MFKEADDEEMEMVEDAKKKVEGTVDINYVKYESHKRTKSKLQSRNQQSTKTVSNVVQYGKRITRKSVKQPNQHAISVEESNILQSSVSPNGYMCKASKTGQCTPQRVIP